MNTLQKVFALSIACALPCTLSAQESAAGSAVAEQLAQSSLRMVGSLVLVLAVVALCSWWLRRWRERQSSDNEAIEIVSGVSLGSKERVVLLRVGQEQVLVGVSPAGMRCLHIVPVSENEQAESLPATKVEAVADEHLSTQPVPATFNLSLGTAQ